VKLKDLPPEQRKRVQEAARVEFVAWCRTSGLPEPTPEFRFHPVRKWRFDYAWPVEKVALEVEGGAWTGGRHTRGKGFTADMAKYSEAAALGWRLVRTTPSALYSGHTLDLLRRALR
jgi:hypothetical protein